MLAIGGGIGFTMAFSGPAEGFLIILFAHFLNMDFLRGSAEAKIINVSTNNAAIAYFALSVDVT